MVFFRGLIFLKDKFAKFVGFSLGVNQLWTERTDHALKSKCVGIFSGLCSHSGIIRSYHYIIIRVSLHRGRWKMVFFRGLIFVVWFS
jgi:hypothetical protein